MNEVLSPAVAPSDTLNSPNLFPQNVDATGFGATGGCRSCSERGLQLILSLHETPLANNLLSAEKLDESEAFYPLELAFCPHCTMVQITHTVSPAELFEEYLYFSSFSDTMLRHAAAIAHDLIKSRQLDEKSLVVEIASNDGYLLKNFVDAGIPVLGIEPARNIAEEANAAGIHSLPEFFSAELAAKLATEGVRADVMLANNVMAHVPDINSVVRGIKVLLKPNGVFVTESPYLKDMIDHLEFDTIYHEHVFYHSLTAMENLFRRHGLKAIDAQRVPIHGGSLRLTFAHEDYPADLSRVQALLDEEKNWGVGDWESYHRFAARVEELRDSLKTKLHDLKAQGKSIAAYGASAKGSTLLNYFGIGRDVLDFVVDRSTVKQGLYTPGTHLPIYAPEHLLEVQPDYVLLLTWNFAEEILEQQSEYRARGGQFIIPIPTLRVA